VKGQFLRPGRCSGSVGKQRIFLAIRAFTSTPKERDGGMLSRSNETTQEHTTKWPFCLVFGLSDFLGQ
jgi:hypothetical protein